MITRAKKIVYSILLFSAFLFVLESSARILESSLINSTAKKTLTGDCWQTRFFQHFLNWQEPDPYYLWRLRKNLNTNQIETNSLGMIGEEPHTADQKSYYRILLLGDSSPAGVTLSNWRSNFGEVLRVLLDVRLTDYKGVDLLNASVPGYSSEQIKSYFERNAEIYKPDLVILYCGNNDASISGSKNDRELLQSARIPFIRKTASNLALYRLIYALLSDKDEKNHDIKSLQVRVSPEYFEQNLDAIARQCSKIRAPLIIIKPPVPLYWPAGLQFKIFTNHSDSTAQMLIPPELKTILNRELMYCLPPHKNADPFARAVYSSAFRPDSPVKDINVADTTFDQSSNDPITINNAGVLFWESKNFSKAEICFAQAREKYRQQSQKIYNPVELTAYSPLLYNTGINLLSLGSHDDSLSALAEIYLDSALQCDFGSLRVKRNYLECIDRVSINPGVFALDPSALFQRNGGENLFVDHCHPTIKGHQLIAHQLYDLIVHEIIP